MVKKMKGLKGISPVIAAVILIAVAIAVGVMVSTWVTSWVTTTTGGAGGTASSCVGISYTFSATDVTYTNGDGSIRIKVTNTGTSDVTFNGIEIANATVINSTSITETTLSPGQSTYLTATMKSGMEPLTYVKVLNKDCPTYSTTVTMT